MRLPFLFPLSTFHHDNLNVCLCKQTRANMLSFRVMNGLLPEMCCLQINNKSMKKGDASKRADGWTDEADDKRETKQRSNQMQGKNISLLLTKAQNKSKELV